MNLVVWAERNGVARVSAYRWFRVGVLSVRAWKVGRLILVDESAGDAGLRGRTAVSARVSSADRKADLDRLVMRVTGWATAEQIPVGKVA
jgi:predicted site-specific integrase-resolvase